MHRYNAQRWREYKKWKVGDCGDLTRGSGNWWLQPRIWQLPLTDFVTMLINDYNAIDVRFTRETRNPSGLLTFSFTSLEDAEKYQRALNRKAKEMNFCW